MAIKKNEAENEAAENKSKEAVTPVAKKEQVQAEESKQYIYIGPSIRGLTENAIFTGTKESVIEELKKREIIEKNPQVKTLIVPVERLAANKVKVETAGSLLNKYYNDVKSVEMALRQQEKEGE